MCYSTDKGEKGKAILSCEVPSAIMPFCITWEGIFKDTSQRKAVCENLSEGKVSGSVAVWMH